MIGVGIVGAGFAGEMHAACYGLIDGVQLAAVADVRKDRAQEIARSRGAEVCGSLEEMLQRDDLDLVDICLPTGLHEQAVCAVAERGLHCIVEKPIAIDPASARRMADVTNRVGIKFMVAHVIRFWPEYQFLKRCVEEGRLGKLTALSLTRISPRPGWAWTGWINDARRSGGALLDLHIHDTDFVLYLLGEPQGIDSCGVRTGGAWDYVCTNYHYPQMAVSSIGGWNLPAQFTFRMAYHAVFENGALDFDITRTPTLKSYHADGTVEAPLASGQDMAVDAKAGNIRSLGGYYNELKYFTDCIRRNLPPALASAEEACRSLEWVYRELASIEAKAGV